MKNVLITTLYYYNSVVFSIKKFDIDTVILLIDKNPDETQKLSMKKIRDMFGDLIQVKEEHIDVYDIVKVAKKTVDIIDSMDQSDQIFVNVTHGRKPQSLGVMFGSYQRHNDVNKIFYVTEENKDIVLLPRLTIDLTTSQLEILKNIEQIDSVSNWEKRLKLTKAMIYRNIKELENRGLLDKTDKGNKLTDAGKIAIL